MKIDKSLLEVWEWKENLSRENENISLRETVEKIRREASSLAEKYGVHLKKMQMKEC